jgi:hypothetical protein
MPISWRTCSEMAQRMKLRCIAAGWMLAILFLSGCDSAPPAVATAPPPAQSAPTPAQSAPAPLTPAATATAVAAVRPSPTVPATPTVPAPPTLGPTPRFRTPTPPANPGTVIKDDGTFLVLSHPFFFWTLKLPRDWRITYDRGFELFANNPQQTAFVRLFSEVWSTAQKRLPTAHEYVDYWKNYPEGNLFPIYAAGTQLGESELSPEKYGGPYLRYEFDDAGHGLRYLQVYASGGGPNSVVLTVWSRDADLDATRPALDAILSSLALLPLP